MRSHRVIMRDVEHCNVRKVQQNVTEFPFSPHGAAICRVRQNDMKKSQDRHP